MTLLIALCSGGFLYAPECELGYVLCCSQLKCGVVAVVWAFNYPPVTMQKTGLDHANSTDFKIYWTEL